MEKHHCDKPSQLYTFICYVGCAVDRFVNGRCHYYSGRCYSWPHQDFPAHAGLANNWYSWQMLRTIEGCSRCSETRVVFYPCTQLATYHMHTSLHKLTVCCKPTKFGTISYRESDRVDNSWNYALKWPPNKWPPNNHRIISFEKCKAVWNLRLFSYILWQNKSIEVNMEMRNNPVFGLIQFAW